MKPTEHPYNKSAPVPIAIPHASDGVGSALRRAYPAPGAMPDEFRRLLNQIDASAN